MHNNHTQYGSTTRGMRENRRLDGFGMKRAAAILTALVLLACSPVFAYAEDGDPGELPNTQVTEEAETPGQDEQEQAQAGHLLDTQAIDLGRVPEETPTESDCSALLVADVETGVLIHEKNISARMPVSGAAVQLMTVLVALDYLTPEMEVSIGKETLKDCPSGGTRLGLVEGNTLRVSELLAGMLFDGAVDAAYVIIQEALDRADSRDFGALMEDKAVDLGMDATSYYGCNGTGLESIATSALDQCRLYMEALSNEALLAILEPGYIEVTSKFAPAGRTEKDEPGKEVTADGILRANRNLPNRIENAVGCVVPENRLYDIRLSSVILCNVQSIRDSKNQQFQAVFAHEKGDRADMVMLYWAPRGSDAAIAKK